MKSLIKSKQVPIEKNNNFSIEKEDGDYSLYCKGKYVCELMSHKPTFFESGVLLSKYGFYDEKEPHRSFIFVNNNGQVIFDINNYYIKGIQFKDFPEYDIAVRIGKGQHVDNLAEVIKTYPDGKQIVWCYNVDTADRILLTNEDQLSIFD